MIIYNIYLYHKDKVSTQTHIRLFIWILLYNWKDIYLFVRIIKKHKSNCCQKKWKANKQTLLHTDAKCIYKASKSILYNRPLLPARNLWISQLNVCFGSTCKCQVCLWFRSKEARRRTSINRTTNLEIFLLGMFSMLLYSTFVANFSSAIQSFWTILIKI